MEKQKINPSKSLGFVRVNYWGGDLGISRKNISIKEPNELKTFKYEEKSLNTFYGIDYPGSRVFDDWCHHVKSISIDLDKEFNSSIAVLESDKFADFGHWRMILNEFMGAIKEHKEQKNEIKHMHSISMESAKRFLFLVPVLASHGPRVYIDASNGCFNVDFIGRENGILSTQISDNGQIHYSYVSENKKIFKITGTAKFKDSRDFIKFNKILKML